MVSFDISDPDTLIRDLCVQFQLSKMVRGNYCIKMYLSFIQDYSSKQFVVRTLFDWVDLTLELHLSHLLMWHVLWLWHTTKALDNTTFPPQIPGMKNTNELIEWNYFGSLMNTVSINSKYTRILFGHASFYMNISISHPDFQPIHKL